MKNISTINNSVSSSSNYSVNSSNYSFMNSICSNNSNSINSSNSSNCSNSSCHNNDIYSNNSSCHNNDIYSNISSSSNNIILKTDSNSNTTNNTRSHIKNHIINNNIIIDVAVLCQEYTQIDKVCEDHIINLDDINISKDLFRCIFYPNGENFGIDKNFIHHNNKEIFPYISFLPQYRTINDQKFYLLEKIISNIENDLNISRNCFTADSLVELTNEIISINSLCDINCCSVLASLTWSNILEIINNYKFLEDDKLCNNKKEITPIYVISIIFKTPTAGVNNTIIRFNYKIIDT